MTQQAITPGVLGDWQLSVAEYGDGGDAPTEFTLVRGLTEFTPPQIEKNLEDDGEFDGSPWGSEVATGISWTAEGTVKVPRASLARTPARKSSGKPGAASPRREWSGASSLSAAPPKALKSA